VIEEVDELVINKVVKEAETAVQPDASEDESTSAG
jgi:hypothetical protein